MSPTYYLLREFRLTVSVSLIQARHIGDTVVCLWCLLGSRVWTNIILLTMTSSLLRSGQFILLTKTDEGKNILGALVPSFPSMLLSLSYILAKQSLPGPRGVRFVTMATTPVQL